MEAEQIKIRTISPIFIPMTLKTGLDQLSPGYSEFLTRIGNQNDTVLTPQTMIDQQEYESIEKDSRDNRLFIWRDPSQAPGMQIHVFPNNIGIVEIDLTLPYSGDAKALEQSAQEHSKSQIQKIFPTFVDCLKKLSAQSDEEYFKLDPETNSDLNIFWISRTLMTSSKSLPQPSQQRLLTDWLAHTFRPEDAADLISGQRDYSMTWLNYVLVDVKSANDARLSSMILAQYYYAAQENCNKLLKQAIDSAYSVTRLDEAQHKLSHSRVVTRLHQIEYHQHLKYITRAKRHFVEEILNCWDYAQLTENGQRMIDVCSSRLEETENKRRERSSLMTDLLLVALSFFTVFELSLYLMELSREMMSRPALNYNDENASFFFQFIAAIDTDVMFGSGFFLTLLLVVIYKIIKSR